MANIDNEEREIRLQKIEKLRSKNINPYPEKFDKTHTLKQCFELKQGAEVKTAGRIMQIREMGKIIFCHLLDDTLRMQVVLRVDDIGKNNFKDFVKLIDIGDFIGIEGEIFTTKKGEISILVSKYTFLGKAILPLPEKWHGLKEQEQLYRKRYLDLISNPETKKRFEFRSKFIQEIRKFYWQQGFSEVETPVLLHKATGAHAKPYITHNNALDIDVYLRISHELPLKELIVGGYEKIFELGKAFRNEGRDPSHLPEHTHLEHYTAYWNYEDNMKFTEQMFDYLFEALGLEKKIIIKDAEGNEQEVDFTTPWKRINYIDLIKKDSGVDVMELRDRDELLKIIKKKKIKIDGMEKMGYATLVDNLYKKVSRPKLIGPVFLTHYPIELQPLARRNDKDNRIVDQFQLVINGWEVVKAYSELVDPIDQDKRFKDQEKLKTGGDEETMEGDSEFITAMEHGMPPISGWGMGIDRIVALLTGQENLRDVVLFPLMKPLEHGKSQGSSPKKSKFI